MKFSARHLLLLIAPFLLASCIKQLPAVNRQQAIDIAWVTLEPNTDTHLRKNWEILDAKKVQGGEVVSEFISTRMSQCPGRMVPENLPIKVSSEYWYIKVSPNEEISQPITDSPSTSTQTAILENQISEAMFLIDSFGGSVVAQKLICQAYP